MFPKDTNKKEKDSRKMKSNFLLSGNENFKSKSIAIGNVDKTKGTKGKDVKICSYNLDPDFIERAVRFLEVRNGPQLAIPVDHIYNIFEHFTNIEDRFMFENEVFSRYNLVYEGCLYPFLVKVYNGLNISLEALLTAAFLFYKHCSMTKIPFNAINEHLIIAYVFVAVKFTDPDPPILMDLIRVAYLKNLLEFNFSPIPVNAKKLIVAEETKILENIDFGVATPHLFDYVKVINHLELNAVDLEKEITNVFIQKFLSRPQKLFGVKEGIKICAFEIITQAFTTKKRPFV